MRGASSVRAGARRSVIRALGRAHVLLYRLSRGRLLGRIAGMPVVLLTTTGRRTGRERTVALTALRDGSTLVLVGSFGGSDLSPAWLLNLRADPRATVRLGPVRRRVVAQEATDPEHARLWPVVVRTYEGYARYQERTARRIPIVLLLDENGAREARASPAGELPGTV
jgi:deazaflavin-dependent oxidoreductase (nitroreductase family)